jgi:Outer membrane protein beta-barrel domain
MRFSISFVLFLVSVFAIAQNKEIDFSAPDSLYREDQFYLGLSYTNMQNAPSGFDQIKISPNVLAGFLRDFPINKNRTWAIAPGLGYRISVMNHNVGIPENGNSDSYVILNTEFDKNKHILHFVELPLEIRWRTSTPESHKFWRIYTGLKVSYLFFDQYKYQAFDVKIRQNLNADIEKLHYGAYISAGWNTWNVYAYYGFNPIFKTASINGEKVKMNVFNVGLMFYIL